MCKDRLLACHQFFLKPARAGEEPTTAVPMSSASQLYHPSLNPPQQNLSCPGKLAIPSLSSNKYQVARRCKPSIVTHFSKVGYDAIRALELSDFVMITATERRDGKVISDQRGG